MLRRAAFVLAAVALCVSPTDADAQTSRRQSVALNPLALVFKIFTGEYERALGNAKSFGVSASHWGSDDNDGFGNDVAYLSVDAKFRLYFGEDALRGFSVGATAGYTQLSGTVTRNDGTITERPNAFSAGAILDYNWVMGTGDKYLVGVGIGAKRLFGLDDYDNGGITVAYPTARLSIGFLF